MRGKLLWGLFPVDVDFGPEGGLYVADWIQGWEKTGKGRIFRVFNPEAVADPAVAETKRLLAEGMLGGFHFNDRRYADDDLTIGSIDPYQVFRIFQEIHCWEWESGAEADIAYMIDQSHNLKPKTEEMIQTAASAQELYAKAALVDQEALAPLQASCRLIDAEECLKRAFFTDVTPVIREWRANHGLPQDPLTAFRESGYLERVRRDRAPRQPSLSGAYA